MVTVNKKSTRKTLGGGNAHKKKEYGNTKTGRTNPTKYARASKIRKQVAAAGRGVKRGKVIKIRAPTEYAQLSNDAITKLGRMFEGNPPELTTAAMWSMDRGTKGKTAGSWLVKYKIPAQTMYKWLKKDATGKPRWQKLVASAVVERNTAGTPPLLGRDIEDVLLRAVVLAHRHGVPFKDHEVMGYAAGCATAAGLVNHVTKLPYTEDADMRSWLNVRPHKTTRT